MRTVNGFIYYLQHMFRSYLSKQCRDMETSLSRYMFVEGWYDILRIPHPGKPPAYLLLTFPSHLYNMFPGFRITASTKVPPRFPSPIPQPGILLYLAHRAHDMFSPATLPHTVTLSQELTNYLNLSLRELMSVLGFTNVALVGHHVRSVSPSPDIMVFDAPRLELYASLGLSSAELMRVATPLPDIFFPLVGEFKRREIMTFLNRGDYYRNALSQASHDMLYWVTDADVVVGGHTFPAGTERHQGDWCYSTGLIKALDDDVITYIEACRLVRMSDLHINTHLYGIRRQRRSFSGKLKYAKEHGRPYPSYISPRAKPILKNTKEAEKMVKKLFEAILSNKHRMDVRILESLGHQPYYADLDNIPWNLAKKAKEQGINTNK